MKLRYITAFEVAITEALYLVNGEPACSRLEGLLTADQVLAELDKRRRQANEVIYVISH